MVKKTTKEGRVGAGEDVHIKSTSNMHNERNASAISTDEHRMEDAKHANDITQTYPVPAVNELVHTLNNFVVPHNRGS
jgi:hypothetical protein